MLTERFTPLDPWRDLDAWFDEMLPLRRTAAPARPSTGVPVRLLDAGERLELTVPMPGLRDDQVELTVAEDRVTLKARREVVVPEGYEARRRERPTLDVSQTYALREAVDPQGATATLEAGVLRVSLPKRGVAGPRTIPVNAD